MRTVRTDDLEAEIGRLTAEGFRLAMIFPADAPRTAEMARDGEAVRIELNREPARDGEWHAGRAGMEYRDLIPDRLGGRVIASHIRIPAGGPIPDYVHYHEIDFQVLYCIAGSARLVYEDQGGPFDFEAGDCVLQPPGIRHRVLECSDGFEVLEVGSPAEHFTFVDHSLKLPTVSIDRDRDFKGQKFVRFRNEGARPIRDGALEIRDTGISAATGGSADVRVWYATAATEITAGHSGTLLFFFVKCGRVRLRSATDDLGIEENGCFALPAGKTYTIRFDEGTEVVRVTIV